MLRSFVSRVGCRVMLLWALTLSVVVLGWVGGAGTGSARDGARATAGRVTRDSRGSARAAVSRVSGLADGTSRCRVCRV